MRTLRITYPPMRTLLLIFSLFIMATSGLWAQVVANFGTSASTHYCGPFTVQFSDSSFSTVTNLVSWEWDFGDGNTSTDANPFNIFEKPGNYVVELTVEDALGNTDSDTAIIRVFGPQIVLTSVAASCGNNGAAAVAANSGTAPYSYQWSNGGNTATINNLQAGTYWVTVTDAQGCAVVGSVVVANANSLVFIYDSSTPASCETSGDGAAEIVATGGVGPYEYSLDGVNYQPTGVFNNLNGTNYGLYIRDNTGCVLYDTLNVGTVFNGTVSVGTPICGSSSGTIVVSMVGAPGAFKYSLNNFNYQRSNELTVPSAGNYTVYVRDTITGCVSITDYSVSATPPLSGYLVGRGPTCTVGMDGRASVYVTGGTPPYTYTWSNAQSTGTITNLTSGIYAITVTDANGCTITDNITLESYLTTDVQVTNIWCNGGANGEVNVTFANGGVAPYSFSIDGGNNFSPLGTSITGLTAGTYDVIVQDNNGCSFDTIAIITEPSPLVAGGVITPASCAGCSDGSIQSYGTGGAGGYTYSWNTGDTSAYTSSLSTGTYHLTITDANGCIVTESFTVGVGCNINVALAVTTPISCDGDADGVITSTIQGGTAPYTYTWLRPNTGGGPPPPPGPGDYFLDMVDSGSYSITVVDDNGCVANGNILVSDPDPITISTTVTHTTCGGCADGAAAASVSGGTVPYTYAWGTTPIQTASTATGLSVGTYSLTVTDANGCSAVASFSVSTCTLVLTSAGVPATCNGANDGAIHAITGSGVRPFEYSIDNGITWQPDSIFTGLTAGVYTIIARDALGCEAVHNNTVTQPSQVVVTVLPTNASCPTCNDGMVIAVATGGTPGSGYQFSWVNGDYGIDLSTDSTTGLQPGPYSVTVTDANGCEATASTTVQGNCNLAVNAGPDTVICSGPYVISPIVTGGTAPFLYTWSTGDATPQITVSNPGTSVATYVVWVTDNNNCTVSDTIEITFGNAAFNAGGDTLICLGESTVIGAIGGVAYSWSPAAGLNSTTVSQPVASPTVSTTYQVDITDAGGCVGTFLVQVDVDTNCVWPGDANSNGVADNDDVLAIGIGYGYTGPIRNDASLVWVGQPAPMWTRYLANGANLKHADCNGDGVVDANDTLAVSQNYGLIHAKQSPNGRKSEDPQLYFVFSDDSIAAGATLYADVYLGRDTLPVDSAYGLAFSLMYDNMLVDTATTSFTPEASFWLGTPGTDLITFQKDLYGNGKLDLALTRIDHTNRSGFGKLGTVSMTMKDDISGKQWVSVPLILGIEDAVIITANEFEVLVYSEEQSINVYDPLSGIGAMPSPSALRIYPNPANGQLYVDYHGANITQLHLTNLLGQTVLDMQITEPGTAHVNIQDINAGSYFVQVLVNGQWMVKKVIIER